MHFDEANQTESVNGKIDKLTKILENQKMTESPEKDDWVSLEELKQDINESCKFISNIYRICVIYLFYAMIICE